MAQVPAKIVLKSTTRMSLNDRFTNIQKSRPPVTVQNIRAKMAAQQQASVRNRRLAQQMANRPSVIAALKIKRSMEYGHAGAPPPRVMAEHSDPNTYLNQRSLKQRLGKSNVKSRLSLSVMRGRGSRSRGSRGGRFRGRGLNPTMRGGMSGRSRGGNLSRQHSALSLGTSGPGGPMEDGRSMGMLRGRGRGGSSGRYRGGRQRFRGGGGRGMAPGGGGMGPGPYMNRFRGSRGGGGGMRSRGGGGPVGRGGGGGGRFRGGRGGPRGGMRGGGRGRGGGGPPGMGGGGGGQDRSGGGGNPGSGGQGGGGGNPMVLKQELDSQLDEYMSKTKAHLDAELDAYMAQANEQG